MNPRRSIFNLRKPLLSLLLGASLAGAPAMRSAESFWTNNASADFTNVGAWTLGVPSSGDTATFTNTASVTVSWPADAEVANAYFNQITNAATTLAIGSSVWRVTNEFVVSRNADATGRVVHTSGTLLVTNANRTGTLIVGQNGVGTFLLNGGTLEVDRLWSANSSTSFLLLSNGTLKTYAGSSNVASYAITNTVNWTMLGGSNFTIGSSAGTFLAGGKSTIVSGSGTVWSNAGALTVGGGKYNQLITSNGGTLITHKLLFGDATANSANTGIVTGAGSKWVIASEMRVGGGPTDSPVGSMSNLVWILDNALVTVGGDTRIGNRISNNKLIVAGGATLSNAGNIFVAHTGGTTATNNSLVVTNGGKVWVASNKSIYVGGRSADNYMLISDSNSQVETGYLYLGANATAQRSRVFVSNGASLYVYGGEASIGKDAGGKQSEVRVTGPGSLFKLGASTVLRVGSNATSGSTTVGEGSLTLLDGGILEANTIEIGWDSTGAITNRGGTFRFTANAPSITDRTTGLFVLTNGTVEFSSVNAGDLVGDITKITYQGSNTLALASATNAAVASYTVGSGSSFAALDLRGTNSVFRSTGSFTIGAGGALVGAGALQSVVVSNAGVIAPGHSPGTLTFSNDLTLLDSSLLVLEIAGTNALGYDRLVVGNAFAKNGTVLVTNLGWTFAQGDTFDFFDAASVSGAFDISLLPDLGSELLWDTGLFESQGILSVTAIPEPGIFGTMGLSALLYLFLRRRRS